MQKAICGLAPWIREKSPFLASQARLVQEGALHTFWLPQVPSTPFGAGHCTGNQTAAERNQAR